MTLIKICGITNREDALTAIDMGADALGFIAVPESPRYIAALNYQRIRDVLPEGFPTVVVVKRLCDAAKYHAPIVQFYEECGPDNGLDAATRLIQVARIHDVSDLALALSPPKGIDAVLLDAFHAAFLGGSGTQFDWAMTRVLHNVGPLPLPLVLAGGLAPGNIAEAISEVRPYAVDVSSGVEEPKVPGKKSRDRLRKFIDSVRDADQARSAAAPAAHVGQSGSARTAGGFLGMQVGAERAGSGAR